MPLSNVPEWLNCTRVIIIFTIWSKKILKIAILKRPRMAQFYYFCHDHFRHDRRNFWKFRFSNVPEWFNSTIFVSWLFSPYGQRKFWKLLFSNVPEWLNSTIFVMIIFTMVEENIEIWLSKTLQNGLILLFSGGSHTFIMVEENFEIWSSKTFHIDLILIVSDKNNFTMVEENFEIWGSETLQIDLILILSDDHYFITVEENFKIWRSETL